MANYFIGKNDDGVRVSYKIEKLSDQPHVEESVKKLGVKTKCVSWFRYQLFLLKKGSSSQKTTFRQHSKRNVILTIGIICVNPRSSVSNSIACRWLPVVCCLFSAADQYLHFSASSAHSARDLPLTLNLTTIHNQQTIAYVFNYTITLRIITFVTQNI